MRLRRENPALCRTWLIRIKLLDGDSGLHACNGMHWQVGPCRLGAGKRVQSVRSAMDRGFDAGADWGDGWIPTESFSNCIVPPPEKEGDG